MKARRRKRNDQEGNRIGKKRKVCEYQKESKRRN